jgi:hypothetical protein
MKLITYFLCLIIFAIGVIIVLKFSNLYFVIGIFLLIWGNNISISLQKKKKE